MDVLGCYFNFRENVFFNAVHDESTVSESIANFLLIPSHYLFAGRKFSEIKKDAQGNNEGHIGQRFTYNTPNAVFIIKMALSVLALPVSLILGGLAKQLSLWCDSTAREHHEAILKIAQSVTLRPSNYDDLGIQELFSEQVIPSQNLERGPLAQPEIQEKEIEAFKEISKHLKQAQIPYWADTGTLLGIHRYNGTEVTPMIPWDHDIDMAILRQDHENTKRVLRANLDPNKYRIEDWSSYLRPQSLLRVRVLETNTVIDLFHYDIKKDDQTIVYNFSHEETIMPEKWKKRERDQAEKPQNISDVFPLRRMQYGPDTFVYVPNNHETYLKKFYGTDLRPARVWNEGERDFKADPTHPYNQKYGDIEEELSRKPAIIFNCWHWATV